MRVEIRPIEKDKWHGKKGKESFSRPKTIEALADPQTMKYNTGLSEEDVKLLKEKGCSYDLSDDFVSGKSHPFWENKITQIPLKNQTMIFNPNDVMLDFIKVRICKGSKFVANSIKEYEEGLWPEATHAIYDESEEVELKASRTEVRNQAVIKASELSREAKIQIIMIMSGKDVKEKSDNHITVAMNEIIESDPKGLLEQIRKDKDETEVHALVLECLDKNVLNKNGHKIEYKGSNIGGDVTEVTRYLLIDANQELRLRLTAEVNN
jgi:hypothetical protein